jgi:hypothetical protein
MKKIICVTAFLAVVGMLGPSINLRAEGSDTTNDSYGVIKFRLSGEYLEMSQINQHYFLDKLRSLQTFYDNSAPALLIGTLDYQHKYAPGENSDLFKGAGPMLEAYYLINPEISCGINFGYFYVIDTKIKMSQEYSSHYGTYPNNHRRTVKADGNYSINSKLIPIMLGIDYSNNARKGIFYGVGARVGMGIHVGNVNFSSTFTATDTNYSNNTTTDVEKNKYEYADGFQAISIIGEATGRVGYNFSQNLGIFTEAGYFYAPIATDVPNHYAAEPNSALFGFEQKDHVIFDFSGVIYRVGVVWTI